MLNSANNFANLIEQPCILVKDINTNYSEIGSKLHKIFEGSAPPIFFVVLHMNENGPYYSTDPDKFEVCILLKCI